VLGLLFLCYTLNFISSYTLKVTQLTITIISIRPSYTTKCLSSSCLRLESLYSIPSTGGTRSLKRGHMASVEREPIKGVLGALPLKLNVLFIINV